MNASDLLAEFARNAGAAGLAFNARGLARLQVDGRLTVDIEHDAAAGVLHLYASLGNPPPEGREAFFSQLLSLNLFCRRTLGATLALDAVADELMLCRVLALDATDYRSFEQALEDMANALDHLAPALQQARLVPARASAAVPRATAELPAWSIRA